MKNMDKGALTNADMRSPKYKILYGIILTGLILYCVIAVFPVIWVLVSGFKDVKEMYAVPATLFPKEIHFSKILKVWNEMKFYKYYVNTFKMAIIAALFDCVCSGLAGYTLSRLKPKGTKGVLMIIFWLMMVPTTMSTVPLYLQFKHMPVIGVNLLDTYWPIWLMAAGNAFNIILFKNTFDGISSSLIEAAWIDGASNVKVFFRIVIPLSIPVFVVVAVFDINGQLGSFFWPYLLISDRSKTVLGVQMFKLKASDFTMDYQMLAILFSILPQVIIFGIFQNQIMGGVNVGGVKG